MEPQPQTGGSGGQTGGPPLVACGYSGDDDDQKKRKNRRERRAKRQGGLATQIRPKKSPVSHVLLHFRAVIGETKRLKWPSLAEFAKVTAVMIFFSLILIASGLV